MDYGKGARAATGFAVFGFLRHAEAVKAHDALEHMVERHRSEETLRDRTKKLTSRSESLFQAGGCFKTSNCVGVRGEADGPAIAVPGLPVGQTRPPLLRVLKQPQGTREFSITTMRSTFERILNRTSHGGTCGTDH